MGLSKIMRKVLENTDNAAHHHLRKKSLSQKALEVLVAMNPFVRKGRRKSAAAAYELSVKEAKEKERCLQKQQAKMNKKKVVPVGQPLPLELLHLK
jgi:hypothetical protein